MPVPKTPARAQRRPVRDQASEKIRNAILDGTLVPGEVLEDATLQVWLGVSRMPIRDALLALQHEGLVEIRPHHPARVAPVLAEDVEQSLQAIGGVLGAIIRVSLPEVSDHVRVALTQCVDQAIVAVQARDLEAHMAAALTIYEILIESCTNRVLAQIARQTLIPLTFRYRSVFTSRVPNWDLLAAGWGKFKHGIRTRDNVLAELSFEELHRLPLPDLQWDPAVWAQAEEPSAP